MGIDAGSTTLKIVILEPASTEVAYKIYRRHKTNINGALAGMLADVANVFPGAEFVCAVTGSAAMGLAERLNVPFVQEVVAAVQTADRFYPDAQTLIDLGGEDAKMVFIKKGRQPDIRMNGSCAGGTGAFIDQMADLMNVEPEELGRMALSAEKVYPVASRCGVFAKTDVQNLISKHANVADVAMSIFHAVALQTVSSLARGMEFDGGALCIGGPMTFLPALRKAFADLLKMELILPEFSEYFSALGAALQDREMAPFDIPAIIALLAVEANSAKDTLPPLFDGKEDYVRWQGLRNRKILNEHPYSDSETELNCFLGIDSGSTTTKILVMDEDARLVYTFYDRNDGNPLRKTVEGLNRFCKQMDERGIRVRFLASTATGYGEELIRSALGLDYGIVETMAHLSGAQFVDPDASFVLDIGGQDIKAIFIENGLISNIEINEACSSGCGSFLQNFASTMNIATEDFAQKACMAKAPADLGSRCTIFMNSKVKQSLRDNAGIENIAAGLAYSVVKNCLFKVLKMSNIRRMGDNIIVQGGTFRNDAVYRALELLSGKTVASADKPELMGAFGAALYARKQWNANSMAADVINMRPFFNAEALPDCNAILPKELSCKGCANKCAVLKFVFPNGNACYAGNKCEKVFFGKDAAPTKGFNAFEMKNGALFNRKADDADNNLPCIGIPRVLNMFENYPFWHALFVKCGFRVMLSPESTIDVYRKGAAFVMSDNICFPAKLVQGHIVALTEMGVDRIFYPIIIKEAKEFATSVNSYNCPVVSGYPDVIRSSVDTEGRLGVALDKPVINFSSDEALRAGCREYLRQFGIDSGVFRHAFRSAMDAREEYLRQICEQQLERFRQTVKANLPAFIVAGRPYHADPLIHQKVGQTLSDMGVNVFTDDIFRRTGGDGFNELRLVSQWAYPNRVVRAAMEAAELPNNVQLVQLNSFGCGPDSFFIDEVGEILRKAGKNHTVIRIDEIAAAGSVRLRLRSLVESLRAKSTDKKEAANVRAEQHAQYTEADRHKVILIPWFADHLSPFIPALAEHAGYRMENLPKSGKQSADKGLCYGNNEVCFPSVIILGDIIDALQSGRYNAAEVVVAITQTGGQCRATNYLAQIKAGIVAAGFPSVPVVAISSGRAFQNEQGAFKIPYMKFINILLYSLAYADALQTMYAAAVVRETEPGDAKAIFDRYIGEGVEAVRRKDSKALLNLLQSAIGDFNVIPIQDKKLVAVGLVGEIYVKYNDYGQAFITQWLRSQNVEVLTPSVIDFLMQFFVNSRVNDRNRTESNSLLMRILSPAFLAYVDSKMKAVSTLMRNFKFYQPTENIFEKAKYAAEILDLANQFGEGWMIAAEIAAYARKGISRIVCIQPFGCIANHVVAKGIEKRIRKLYPAMNILFLDVDSGVAEVNLHNRLRFLIENA
ncbi:MAG: acyl-CoA dehydratase activase [Tannerellaceae bacterium]|nr:acyl-CoA dehydratase activase [Tannerellaceae bacterium]